MPPWCSLRETGRVSTRSRSAARQPHDALWLPRRRAALHTARVALAPADGAAAAESAAAATLPPWGVGFSAAGLLFPYYVGVAEALAEAGILTGAPPTRRRRRENSLFSRFDAGGVAAQTPRRWRAPPPAR
jgi:hypothetical protein